MRKELPYDIEIVVRSDRIGVFLHTQWLKKTLKARCRGGNGQSGTRILSGDNAECVLTGLVPGNEYELHISRNDIKGLRYKSKIFSVVTADKPYIVLVGGSVGYAWDLPNLSKRLKDERFVMGYRRGREGFDKSNALYCLLESENIPDAIILKECAAYFPIQVKDSIEKMDHWVKMIKDHNIIPIVTTVAPITRECAEKRGPGIIESINLYNGKMREYAHDNDLRILDLNMALEDKTQGHYLKKEYALPDGLHLNEKAYRQILDPLILPLLSSVFH